MKTRHLLGACVLLPCATIATAVTTAAPDVLNSVDLRIGVLAKGSNVIGPALPFGSIHPSPDTVDGGLDGYHPNKPIRGFSQTHASGTGWGTYGNFLVSPQIGLTTIPENQDSPKADEQAQTNQYQVRLTKYNILAQVTPTHSAAIYRFTFPASDQAHIVLNATHSIPGNIATAMFPWHKKPIPSEVRLSEDGRSVWGESRFPGGHGGPYTLYFYAEFDHTPTAFGTWRNDKTEVGTREIKSSGAQEHLGSFVRFNTQAGETVQMKISISFLSTDKAKASLHAEIPLWDYDAVRDAAAAKWRNVLGSITVQGGTQEQRTIFTTALYHAHIMPRDRTGEFARYAPTAPMWDDHYCIWDTWRTLYPLMGIIRPEMVAGTVNSFIERQRVDGAVPDTMIGGTNAFNEQGGNGVDMIIADAFAKQVPGIDWKAAYKVMQYNADHRRTGANFDNPAKGLGPYREQGWIPTGKMSTSLTLEYAQNDYSASLLANALGYDEDAKRYLERSQKWIKLWNPDKEDDGYKGFMMSRNTDGTFADYDPKKYPGSWKDHYYEGTAWTYSYFVPHQFGKLVGLMGGPERFVTRTEHALDYDLVSLHNEPAFLIPQTFHYAGRPDLSAKWLANITNERFSMQGYPGDDDSGAMSAYYIFAKIGIFPNAGQDIYFVNGSAFDDITVNRPGHAPLHITRTGKGIYIAKAMLDGKPLTRSWLRHAELQAANTLDFTMSETPTDWAKHGTLPPSLP